jgi:hypothetical protein
MIRMYHKIRVRLLLVDFPRLLPVFIVDIFTGDDLDELGLKVLIFLNFFLKDVVRSRCSHGALRIRLWSLVSVEIQKMMLFATEGSGA